MQEIGSRFDVFGRLAAALLVAGSILAPALPAGAEAPHVHALTGARIVIAPGKILESGTVVIRDGIITAVGAQVEIPADARIWNLGESNGEPSDGAATDTSATTTDAGADAGEGGEAAATPETKPETKPETPHKRVTLYPGLIDLYTELDWPLKEGGDDDKDGKPPQDVAENPLVRPEREMSRWASDPGQAKKLRKAGITTAVVAPEPGLLRGESALINLGDGGLGDNLLLPRVAQNVTFETRGFRGGYPTSLMGSIALLRQTVSDAGWYRRARAAYAHDPGQERPPYNRSLEALEDVAAGKERVVFETENLDNLFRADRLARELGLDAWLVGNGDEMRRLQAVAALGRPLILPLDFPERPEVGDRDDLTIGLDELRRWDRAPQNPSAVLDAGVTVAFTTQGLDDAQKIHPNLATAIERGLTAEQALAGWTTTPARLLGIADRAGTIEPGKMANLVVVAGDLFVDKPEIREVWIDGNRYEIQETKPPEVEPAGTWELQVTTGAGTELSVVMVIEGKTGALSGSLSAMGQTLSLSEATVSGKTLRLGWDGTPVGMPGAFSMSLQIEGDSARGGGSGPPGSFTVHGNRTGKPTPEEG